MFDSNIDMKQLMDWALVCVAFIIVGVVGALILKDFMGADAQANECESMGMVMIDSSSGRYCFEVPSGK